MTVSYYGITVVRCGCEALLGVPGTGYGTWYLVPGYFWILDLCYAYPVRVSMYGMVAMTSKARLPVTMGPSIASYCQACYRL